MIADILRDADAEQSRALPEYLQRPVACTEVEHNTSVDSGSLTDHTDSSSDRGKYSMSASSG